MCRKNRAMNSMWRGDCMRKQETQEQEIHARRWIDSMTPAELERVRKAIQSLRE